MEAIKEPHTISLKVLRLSRPQLAIQDPLPEDPSIPLSYQASLALPGASIDDAFGLTPLLTLPTTFGTAYVGESFACILSLNNELPPNSEKSISSIKLAAEMQTPSQQRPLAFDPPLDSLIEAGLPSAPPSQDSSKNTSSSVQSTLSFDLREEGTHVLCVNISYTESFHAAAGTSSTSDEDKDSATPSSKPAPPTLGSRVRLLRKLYNFNVGPCLSVRTKATALPSPSQSSAQTPSQSQTTFPTDERYLLECQLENLADDSITMEKLLFEARPPFTSQSLNWDAEHVACPMLGVREVTQVAFLISENSIADAATDSGEEIVKKEITKDGRTVLGVLTIHWRSAMGSLGVLSTGWLASRPRK